MNEEYFYYVMFFGIPILACAIFGKIKGRKWYWFAFLGLLSIPGLIIATFLKSKKEFSTNISSDIPINSFNCFIPDAPLTRWEQITVGATTGGFFRHLWRKAICIVGPADILIRAQTDIISGGNTIDIIRIPIKEVKRLQKVAIEIKKQIKWAFKRSMIISATFGIIVLFIVLIRAGDRAHSEYLPIALAFLIVGSLAAGFFFSFLPNFLKLERDLIEIKFFSSNGQVLAFALKSSEMEKAIALLTLYNLFFTDDSSDDGNT